MSRERPRFDRSEDRYWWRLQTGYWRMNNLDWAQSRIRWASECDEAIARLRAWAGADELDGWSPDLAGLADEWAAWHEQFEERAALEAELEEYQRQMEAAYARQQYEDREDEERRRSSWMSFDEGPWW